MERNGITVAGSLLADVFYNVPTYPSEGLLIRAEGAGMSIGGTGNIILDLAKLDPSLQVTVCAKMGADDVATSVLGELRKQQNVNTDSVICDGVSSKTTVINSADTKQRTFFYSPAASDSFGFDSIPWDKLTSRIFMLEYLLLMQKIDSHDPEYGTHGAKILAEAKRRGMITSIDVVSEASDRAKAIVSAALRYTDICCINELEAAAVTGIDVAAILSEYDKNAEFSANNATRPPIKVVFEKLRSLGVSKWIVIHTKDLGVGFDCETEEITFVPSLTLPCGYVKGSTGAGDAYCSGILYGAHEGYTLGDSMRLARSAAAASLSENNGTDGMRPLGEVMKLEELYG